MQRFFLTAIWLAQLLAVIEWANSLQIITIFINSFLTLTIQYKLNLISRTNSNFPIKLSKNITFWHPHIWSIYTSVNCLSTNGVICNYLTKFRWSVLSIFKPINMAWSCNLHKGYRITAKVNWSDYYLCCLTFS